jgi:hypothetical protein
MCEDVDGGEAGGGVGPAGVVAGAELGDNARVRRQAHAAHRRQPHRHTAAPPALLRVEVQSVQLLHTWVHKVAQHTFSAITHYRLVACDTIDGDCDLL